MTALDFDAVDYANYTRIFTPADLDMLHAQGTKLLVVGCSYGSVAGQQLAATTADTRFRTDAYGFCTFDGSITPWANAYKAIYPFPSVKRMWLDLELPVGTMAPADVIATIQKFIFLGQEWRPDVEIGIYTARWFWDWATDRSHETFGIDLATGQPRKLWYAGYNDLGRDGWNRGEAFGGWGTRDLALKQYAGSVDVSGLNLDLNYILEDVMTPQQIQQLNDVTSGFARLQLDVDGLANILDALPTLKNQLRYVYAIGGKPWPFGN